MKSVLRLFAIAVIAAALASCAQPVKPAVSAKASPIGSRFNSVGKIMMHAGQPCASQIMFDFRMTATRSTIWLAAPMRETKLLTEAANRNRRVHVWGRWQRGGDGGCDYVSVTKVEPLSIAVVF